MCTCACKMPCQPVGARIVVPLYLTTRLQQAAIAVDHHLHHARNRYKSAVTGFICDGSMKTQVPVQPWHKSLFRSSQGREDTRCVLLCFPCLASRCTQNSLDRCHLFLRRGCACSQVNPTSVVHTHRVPRAVCNPLPIRSLTSRCRARPSYRGTVCLGSSTRIDSLMLPLGPTHAHAPAYRPGGGEREEVDDGGGV
ncbi:hypothetical protein DFH06DRAFT_1297620 [Mycena polygramma]|nr:hypothetical protein DFH06DRAFT_1297620 [Mycena polygramma]